MLEQSPVDVPTRIVCTVEAYRQTSVDGERVAVENRQPDYATNHPPTSQLRSWVPLLMLEAVTLPDAS